MKSLWLRCTPLILWGTVMAFLSSQSFSQPAVWPDKPVRLVVPYAPGGLPDTVARVFAQRIGEPYGTLVLALAVTVIESALILSLMLANAEKSAAVPRDTVYAAVMIICNGVVGLSLLIGGLKGMIVNYVVRNVKKLVPAYSLPGAVRFNDALAVGRGQAFARPTVGPDDIAVLQYTGGTTGVSKGAVLLHRNVIANVLQSEAWNDPVMKQVPASEQPTSVCALPLYHIFAFNANMLLALHMGGCNILIPNARDIPALLKALSTERFHSFPAVNTLFNAIANHPDFSTVNWGSLKISVGGGMAVQSGTAQLWLEKTGCPIVEAYGLSETSPAATCNPVDATAWTGSIGLPMPNTDITLLDDEGRPVPPGEPGEICIRGPQVMAGYWQRPDETAKVMTADGYFRSGDIGMVDTRDGDRWIDLGGSSAWNWQQGCMLQWIPGSAHEVAWNDREDGR